MWMVVRTKPRAEKKVEQLLNSISLGESTKPLVADALIIKVKHRWSDRTKIIEIPSVSGYVFVRFDQVMSRSDKTKIINKICFTPGVLRFVTLPGRNQFLLDDIMCVSDRELQICHAAAQESGGSIIVSDTSPAASSTAEESVQLVPGTKVRFRQGPLSALDTTFIIEDINDDTPTLFINEGIFKNARFTVSKDLIELAE